MLFHCCFPFSFLFLTVNALLNPLTTIHPCPSAPSISGWAPITVTSQYQSISTCSPSSKCIKGSCTTKYRFKTWAYVDTVIPCAWNGTKASSTHITSTDQRITISQLQTTLTKHLPAVTGGRRWGNETNSSSILIYQTIIKEFILSYDNLGSLAIPGYEGSGLCQYCENQSDGSRSQVVNVTECKSEVDEVQCFHYKETWISTPAPSTAVATAVIVSHHTVAPSIGVYTFTFPQIASAQTFGVAENTWTAQPSPYYIYITKTCSKSQEVIDFTTTFVKTITRTVPHRTNAAPTSERIPVPTSSNAWPAWPKPIDPAPTITGNTATPTSQSFHIILQDTNVRYRKQALDYLAFTGSDAIITNEKSGAALFTLADGVLKANNDHYVGTDVDSGYAPLELTNYLPTISNGWSENEDGSFSLTSASQGFCVTPDGNVFCLLSSSPSFPCKPVVLGIEGSNPTPTRPAYTITTTVSASSSPDVSGDLGIEPSPSIQWEDWRRHAIRRVH